MIQVIKGILFRVRSLFRRGYITEIVNDEPFYIAPKILYVIGEKEFQAYALMLCPCGCNKKVYLNLLPGNKPTWKIFIRKRAPTLTPSIWNTSGCQSHYFIRSGRVVWAEAADVGL